MKVGIVGCGFVGSTAAYAMVMHGVGREIVLVDMNAARAARGGRRHSPRRAVCSSARNPRRWIRRTGGQSRCRALRRASVRSQVKRGCSYCNATRDVFRQVVPAVLAEAPDAVLSWPRIRWT